MNLLRLETPKKFTKLKGKVFAEYKIIYHINDCFSIKELSDFQMKHQLLFQKFESKVQQMNLLLVDSLFPAILADVAIDVFLNNVKSFNEYIDSKKMIKIFEYDRDKSFIKHKFFTFIHLLLYSDINSEMICNVDKQTDKIFCLKNDADAIQFYTIYEQSQLQLMLLDKMKLEINFKSSTISKDEVKLDFRIRII